MDRWVIVVSVAASLLSSCKNETQCERERLDLTKTWSELHAAATHRKLEGSDISTWTEIETKAELLESSFMTPQVTWTSAKKASQELASKLPALESNGDVRLATFRASTESAIKQQNDFEKACR